MDLEINAEAVSRLVLGHLRTEKNKCAYKEYLNSCQHFRNISSPTNKRKFINTRLHGLSLLEILQEYAAVYNLVQEYLDGVGYFRSHKRTCLFDELEYLLSLTGAKFDLNRSRSSTPLRTLPTSPLMQPNNHLSPIVESEVNTTALQDLPGNTAENSAKGNYKDSSRDSSKETCKDKQLDKSGDVRNEGDEVDNNQESPEQSKHSTIDCSLERIQQTILEHPEFQAKIAENINSIINASVQSINKENTDKPSTKAVTELDSTIKMILQKTEEDPLFERLLEDLIGDATSVSSQQIQNVESSDHTLHTPKKLPTTIGNTANIKLRLRSSRKSTANDTLAIEFGNNDAFDKIVAAATVCATTDMTSTILNVNNGVLCNGRGSTGLAAQATATTACQSRNLYLLPDITTTTNTLSNAEIILYDGPIDTLFQQNASTTAQNTLNSATPGLLMLQSHNQSQTIVDDSHRLTSQSQTATMAILDGTNCPSLVNVASCDVVTKQQPHPCYMISDNGDMISLPPQMIICTSDAATMQQPQYITATTMAPQNVAASATIVLPPAGTKYLTLSTSADKTPNALVDLFSSYKGTEPTTSSTQNRKRCTKPEKPPVKRIKTILPMPTYKIDILPIPEEHPLVPIPIILDNAGVKENIPSNVTHCQETPMNVTPEMTVTKKSTPKSSSHVRVLDFNFVTPSKDIADKPTKKDVKNGKSVKSLFSTPSANTKKITECPKSWDSNLRELAVPSAVPKSYPCDVQNKPAEPLQQPSEVPKIEDVLQNRPESVEVPPSEKLNDTLQEANSIEKVLLLDNNAPEQAKNSKKHPKKVVKKSLRIRQNVQKTAEKAIENSPNTVEAADTLLTLGVPTRKEELVELSESTVNPANHQVAVGEPVVEVPQGSSAPNNNISTLPATNKPRYKRKCNIDSSIKQEVTVTRVKEIKSLDILTENGAKLILSPSKLANKRSIVIVDKIGAETADLTKMIMNMPTLETPIKLNPYNNVPDTPNISTTTQVATNETPFTKMFNEQVEGIDISAIPTPKLPITPSLNLISPYNIGNSGCYNRPTDYSTSSSYYQPSDSEQNKSLEKQIIEECKRLEKTKKTPNAQQDTQTDVLEQIEEDKQREVEKLEAIATAMKTMKTSIGIGRKDLNLMSKVRDDSSSSSDDNSSSSCSSSSSTSDSESDESYNQNTVGKNKEAIIYKLRSRTVSPVECTNETVAVEKSKPDFQESAKDINAILSSTNFKSELKVMLPDITLTQQETVLSDMEAKRKRTIAKFKGSSKKEVHKNINRGVTTRSSRGRLIKPVASNSVVVAEDKNKLKKEDKDQNQSQSTIKTAPVKERSTKVANTKSTKSKTSPRNKKSTSRPTKTTKRKSPVKSQKSSAAKLTIESHQLDPLDIVETHLSEHSAASTPVREEQPSAKKQTQEESQSILNQILISAKGDQGELIYKTVKTQSRSENNIKEKDGNKGRSVVKVKVPENNVSPDLEAEKLVKGLKQWGIHLIPKAKVSDILNEETSEKLREEMPTLNISSASDKPDITFDNKLNTEADIIKITFNPNMAASKTISDYDLEVLNRNFTSRIFIEELNQDVDIPLSVSPFKSILDIPDQNDTTLPPSTSKIHILNEVIVTPKMIPSESFTSLEQSSTREMSTDRRKLLDILSKSPGAGCREDVPSKQAVQRNSADFLNSSGDAMPKCITDFQMIKDMRAKLESAAGSSTPRPDDDSLYDFALTNARQVELNASKLSKKRLLNDSAEDLSPKRPKVDHEKILQELQASDKKKSSKTVPSTSNPVKSKSDRQLLERIDVEHFLSVLHP